MKIISYYTIDTPYEKEITSLVKSIKNLGLAYYIQGIDNLGSWEANTHYKAVFIKKMFGKFKRENLLYVDSDAIIRSYPTLLNDVECDIAVRYQDFRWYKGECLSGTIFLKPTMKTMELVDEWIELNSKVGGIKNLSPSESLEKDSEFLYICFVVVEKQLCQPTEYMKKMNALML